MRILGNPEELSGAPWHPAQEGWVCQVGSPWTAGCTPSPWPALGSRSPSLQLCEPKSSFAWFLTIRLTLSLLYTLPPIFSLSSVAVLIQFCELKLPHNSLCVQIFSLKVEFILSP